MTGIARSHSYCVFVLEKDDDGALWHNNYVFVLGLARTRILLPLLTFPVPSEEYILLCRVKGLGFHGSGSDRMAERD